ncbi:YybH family protein [candidate division KSB1 bacterium]
MKKAFVLLMIFTAFLITGCGQGVDIEAEKADVLATSKAYSDAIIAKDIDLTMSFFAEDCIWPRSSGLGFKNIDDVREANTSGMSQPETKAEWVSERIEVASGGGMAFEAAVSNQTRLSGEETVDVTYYFLAVWKKQTDGKWQMIAFK